MPAPRRCVPARCARLAGARTGASSGGALAAAPIAGSVAPGTAFRSRNPSSLSNCSSAPASSRSWIQRLMSAWLAAASAPKAGERCAERGAVGEPRSSAVSPVRPSGQRSASTSQDRPRDVVRQRRDRPDDPLRDGERRAARRTCRSPPRASPRSARRPAGDGSRATRAKRTSRSARPSASAFVTGEQLVDPHGRVGRRVGHLDLHRTARVEAAPDESGLLEHSDEDARVRIVAELLGA